MNIQEQATALSCGREKKASNSVTWKIVASNLARRGSKWSQIRRPWLTYDFHGLSSEQVSAKCIALYASECKGSGPYRNL